MNDKNYDSKKDTKKHIEIVGNFISTIGINLEYRKRYHDASKLKPSEKEMYDKFVPLLRELTYGSDEYKESLKEMGIALDHHYKHNSHHPEHYENGINGMNLMDIVEMFCDWQAAVLRHDDGDFVESMKINKQRFDMSDQLYDIFMNTFQDLIAI